MSTDGRSDGGVGSGRNSRLLSSTASRDELSGAIFFLRVRVNTGRAFTELHEISAGFKHNKPKKCMHVRLCTQVCWRVPRLPLRLPQHPPTLSHLGIEGATFKFSYLEGEQLINIFGFVGVGQ